MASRSQLSPSELTGAIASAAAVVRDHSVALDQLESAAWGDDGFGVEESERDDSEATRGAGSALTRTLDAAAAAMTEAPNDMAHVASSMESGGRAASCGSAVVEVLAGLAEALRNADRLDAERCSIGLEIAAERLAAGDDGAHSGCLPAVVAASAAGALAAFDAGADLGDTIIAAADEGLVELEAGLVDNPVLAERGAVDAAAAGFLLLLDVMASTVTGEPLPEPPSEQPSIGSDGRLYEVRCRIRPHDGCGIESANWLESTWFEMGELVEFDGLGATWRAGVITTSPGAAVEAIFEVGRPQDLHIGLAPAAS